MRLPLLGERGVPGRPHRTEEACPSRRRLVGVPPHWARGAACRPAPTVESLALVVAPSGFGQTSLLKQ